MPAKSRKRKAAKKYFHIWVNPSDWPGFTETQLQDIFGKHMHGNKAQASGKKASAQSAQIYIGMGSNPMSFSITICPTYPCTPPPPPPSE